MASQTDPQGVSTTTGRAPAPSLFRVIAGFAFVMVTPILIFFLGSGRWDWWEAWLYIGIFFATTIGSRILLLCFHPDTARERSRYGETRNVPDWDRKLMPLIAIFGPLLAYLVAALDKRWGASPVLPVGLEIAAMALVLAGTLWGFWALLENRFFSAVVRIQTDRGHTVVRTGPYRWMRHPGYAGGVLCYLAFPVAVGALWALLPVAAVIAGIVLRTALEDRMLQAELPGYAEYARETRWRLLPGVW